MTNRVLPGILASIAFGLLIQCACSPVVERRPSLETPATDTALPSPAAAQERSSTQSAHEARGTQIAESLQTPSRIAGVVVSMPSEIKWEWSGTGHQWNWDIHLQRLSEKPITLTYRKIEVFTTAGGAYQRVESLNVVIQPHGEWVDHIQITVSPNHEFHDATCLVTYNGFDDEISRYIDQGVTRLSHEEK